MASLVAGAIAYGPKGCGNCTTALPTSDLLLGAETANLGILRLTALPALGFGNASSHPKKALGCILAAILLLFVVRDRDGFS